MKNDKFKKIGESLSKITKGRVNESNAKTFLGGLVLFVALIIFIVVIFGAMVASPSKKKTDSTTETKGTEVSETQTESVEDSTREAVKPVENVPFEENQYPQINELSQKYLTALSNGDMDTLNAIYYPLSEVEQLTLQCMHNYIDRYELKCVYTKPGPIEGSFAVFVYYDVYLKGIDTAGAALDSFYAVPNEDGEYHFAGGKYPEEESAYLTEIGNQQDVIDLVDMVNIKSREQVDSVPELAQTLQALSGKIKEDVAELLAQAQLEDMETQEVEETAETETQEASEAEKEIDYENVRATDTVNVRKASSEDADKIGKLAKNKVVKRTESLANGWSCIEYEGKIGYVKSEYLAVKSIVYVDGTTENIGGGLTPSTTINVRVSPSEEADKVGVVKAGEELTVLENLENGWTKIEYNGKEAYVKTEFLN